MGNSQPPTRPTVVDGEQVTLVRQSSMSRHLYVAYCTCGWETGLVDEKAAGTAAAEHRRNGHTPGSAGGRPAW